MTIYVNLDLKMENVPEEFDKNPMTVINDLLENGTVNGYFAQNMKVSVEDMRVNSVYFDEENNDD